MKAHTGSKGRKVRKARHTGRWILLLFVILIAGVATLVISLGRSAQPETASFAEPAPKGHFMDPKEVRTVKVAPEGEPMELDLGGTTVAIVTLVSGMIPNGATMATVLTDEECAPDQSGPTKGWSHCKNRVEFADGSQAVLQHHHKLAEVGCFTPGQTISII